MTPRAVAIDIRGLDLAGTTGAAWSLPHGGDLDANVVVVQPGAATGAHVNAEVDVLIVGLAGARELTVGTERHGLHGRVLVHLAKGASRAITADDTGALVYATSHRRRAGIRLAPRR